MARLQDFQTVTPSGSDKLLIVQSQGQGLSTLDNVVGVKMDKANPTGTGNLTMSGDVIYNGNHSVTDLENRIKWLDIQSKVRSGAIKSYYSIGDEIKTTWTSQGGTSYDFPWIVVNFGTCINGNDVEVPCMVLQAKYCDPIGMPFSGYPALFACPNGLNAGTYHFKCANTWGNITGNTNYQFTLTQNIPNGSLLCAPQNWPDVAIANWKMTTYASNTATTAIESATITTGSSGTDLGTFTAGYSSTTMNGYQVSAYGYSRWSQSAIRQWLNSTANANQWWQPQNAWDRAPSKASTERGFLGGFPSYFRDSIGLVKVKTALNNSDKTKEGIGYEYTYDKLFLPCLEEMYINPQATGDDKEADFWEYYHELNGTATKYVQRGTYPELIKYDLTNHSTARYQRLRSAYRDYSSFTWNVNPSGIVNYGYAIYALQCAPACIIC